MGMFAKLTAILGLDTTQFKSGADQAKAQAQGMGSSLGSLAAKIGAAFSVGAIIAGGRSVVSSIDAIGDAAERLGISTRSYQLFTQTFEEAGVEATQLEQALNRLRVAQDDLRNGSAEAAKKFAAFGISLGDAASMKIEDLFVKISQSSFDAGGNMTKLTEISDLFGSKVGPRMANAMKEIAAGLDALAVDRSIIDPEDLANIDKLDKATQRIGNTMKAWAGKTIAPAVNAYDYVTSGDMYRDLGWWERDAKKGKAKPRTKGLDDVDQAAALVWQRIGKAQEALLPLKEQLAAKQREINAIEETTFDNALSGALAAETLLKLDKEVLEIKKKIADEEKKATDEAKKRNDLLAEGTDILDESDRRKKEILNPRTALPSISSGSSMFGTWAGVTTGPRVSPMWGASDRASAKQDALIAEQRDTNKKLMDVAMKMDPTTQEQFLKDIAESVKYLEED